MSPRLEIGGVPGIRQGNDYPGATETRNQVGATLPHVSVGGDQDDFRPAPGRDAENVLQHSVDVGSLGVLRRGLAEIVAIDLRYDGREGKNLELSALEGVSARGREIRQAVSHRSADIQIEVNDRRPH